MSYLDMAHDGGYRGNEARMVAAELEQRHMRERQFAYEEAEYEEQFWIAWHAFVALCTAQETPR